MKSDQVSLTDEVYSQTKRVFSLLIELHVGDPLL